MIRVVGALALLLAAACPQAERPAGPTTAPVAGEHIAAAGPAGGAVEQVPPCAVTPLAERATVVFVPDGASEARVGVEVARTPPEKQKGLMCRRTMADEAGMLFLFDEEETQSFWMQHTYLPLDMVFVREDLTVAGVVADAEPLTLTPRFVDAPSRYVVEVNAGWTRRHGIGPGTRVRFEGVKGIP